MSETENSTGDSPRDSSSGQFAPAAELYGIEGVEKDAGFISRSVAFEKADTPESYGSDEESLRALARKKWGDRRDEPDKIEVLHLTGERAGERAPENLAQTVEQAASDLNNLNRWQRAEYEAEHLSKVAEEVDAKRAEKLKAGLGEHYGLTDAKAAEAEAAENAITPEVQAMIDSGVSRQVAEAISHPEVRASIEQEFSRADQVRESYTAGLEQARVATLATLAEVVPHLTGLPPQQFEQGLALLSQVDPPAFNQAMNILGRTNQIVVAQQAAQQHAQQVQYQQFESEVRSEDARLAEMMGGEQQAAAANQAMVSYLAERGVPKNQMMSIVFNNPVLRTAEARQTIWEAAKYREMKSAPAKVAPKPVPTVQKPGTARSAGDRDASELVALRDKAKKSGSTEDVFALYQAKKGSRR
jgi:hypothetical protein